MLVFVRLRDESVVLWCERKRTPLRFAALNRRSESTNLELEVCGTMPPALAHAMDFPEPCDISSEQITQRSRTMPFRTPTIVHELAPTFLALLAGHHSSASGSAKTWFTSLINHACRELEDFIEPKVSVKAFEVARSMNLGDLRDFHWDSQVRRMNDPDRSIFHWEHFVPVSVLRRRLLGLVDPTASSVTSILAAADIAWILKAEDVELSRLGYRSQRETPLDAYLAAGIEFVRPTQAQ